MKSSNDQDVKKLFDQNRQSLTYLMPKELKQSLLEEYDKAPAKKLWWVYMISGAIAASLVFMVATQLGPKENDNLLQEVTSVHLRSLMAGHLADVVSTDRHTVKPWFDGRIDFAPNVRDFSENGFPLTGGRLDYADGRPIAALIYKHGLHIINVLQWPSGLTNEESPKFSERRGYQIFKWQKSGMTYWAISDLNAVDLQKFVSLWSTE